MPAAKQKLYGAVDVVILCLPDEAAKEAAQLIDAMGDKAPRVIDASSAHRVAPGWTYGFPELVAGQGEAVAKASKVTNPGCHATGAIALLRPLTDAGLLPRDMPVSIGSVSGYSGGGKAMIEAYETGKAPAFELYAPWPRAQAHAGDRALFRPDAAADLRALGRQFPPGHAGQRAPASRRAAGEAQRLATCAPFTRSTIAARSMSMSPRRAAMRASSRNC